MSTNQHYEVVLADLKQMKAEAEAGIRAIERLMSRQPSLQSNLSEGRLSAQGSVPTRIVDFLESHAHRSWSVENIAEAINAPVNTVRGAVGRMTKGKNGKITRPSRGRYRAKAQRSSEPEAENVAAA